MRPSCKLVYLISEFPFGHKYRVSFCEEITPKAKFECFLVVGGLRCQITERADVSTFVHIMHKGKMLLHLIGRWFRVIVLVAGRQPYGADQHSRKGYVLQCCSHFYLCLEL